MGGTPNFMSVRDVDPQIPFCHLALFFLPPRSLVQPVTQRMSKTTFQRLEGYLQSGAGPRKANSFGSRASGMPILSYLLGGRPPQLRPGWLPFLVFHWGARILGLCTHDMPGGIPSLDDTDSCSAEGGDPDSAVVSQYLPLPLFFPLKKKKVIPYIQ